jgi:Domain of unknown function (DUF397)
VESLAYRKSSYSGQQNNCVEVADTSEGASVRDSKTPEGPALHFTADTWRAFLAGVKSGQMA